MTEPLVTIAQGILRGKLVKNILGGEFFSFQGIPYAKPPVGKLRFKAPRAPDKWQEILDATKEGQSCYGRNFIGPGMVGEEDCLFLNVYTKEIQQSETTNELRPVMFWIHGGGFTAGSGDSNIYGADFLVKEDIVLVTINYRLGLLGFLSIDDPNLGVPGNAGLKDQVMALKWVRDNISKFGGDPNNVTIFGESAGAASVHYLVLSPMSKGLFHKAIAQSGSALCSWAQGTRSLNLIAIELGMERTDPKTILEKLQELPVDDLYNKLKGIRDFMNLGDLRPYGPVIEKPSNEPAFLLEDPIKIIQNGTYNKVPMIMGCTDKEGLLIYATMAKHRRLHPKSLISHHLNVQKRTPLYDKIYNKIKYFYMKDENDISDKNEDNLINLYTDGYFLIDVIRTVEFHVNSCDMPIYYYNFQLDTTLQLLKIGLHIEKPGACHGDDLSYLFHNLLTPELEPDSIENLSIAKLTTLWTNFAKHGNPTPEENNILPFKWEPVTKNSLKYLNIGKTMEMKTNLEEERVKFWKEIRSMEIQQSKL